MDDREVAKYFAGLLVIWGVPLSLELPGDRVGVLTAVAGLAIALFGFRAAYQTWESHRVQPLLSCIVPLAFCTGVRLALTVLALLVVGGGLFVMFGTSVGLNLGELDDEASAIPSVVIALALQCVYWYMLNRQVRWLGSSAA